MLRQIYKQSCLLYAVSVLIRLAQFPCAGSMSGNFLARSTLKLIVFVRSLLYDTVNMSPLHARTIISICRAHMECIQPITRGYLRGRSRRIIEAIIVWCAHFKWVLLTGVVASQPLLPPHSPPPTPVVGACENRIGGGNDSTLHLSLPNSRHRYKVVELVLVILDLFGLIESLWLEMKSEKKKNNFPWLHALK